MVADRRQQLVSNQGFPSNSHVVFWFSVAGPVLKLILGAANDLAGFCVFQRECRRVVELADTTILRRLLGLGLSDELVEG